MFCMQILVYFFDQWSLNNAQIIQVDSEGDKADDLASGKKAGQDYSSSMFSRLFQAEWIKSFQGADSF